MKTFRQIGVVTALNMKNLPSRFWPSMVIVVGMACVIGVLLSMLSLSTGMFAAYMKAGDPERVIVTSLGSASEGQSSLTRPQTSIIMDAPGIMKGKDGKPMADPELLGNAPLYKKENGLRAFALVRGFGPKGIELRPEIKIVQGRMYQPGKREVIVGVGAQSVFSDLEIGDKINLPDGEWPVVGVFSTGGDQLESAIIGDVALIQGALRRPTYASVLTRLDPKPGSFDAMKKALTTNPQLSVIVERHSTYYVRVQSQPNLAIINIIAYSVGIIMAIGALFGSLNTMYAAVGDRTREIATLRALGFGAFPVAVSVIFECIILAVAGAAIGAAIAWLLYDGVQDTYGSNVFHMSVPPARIALGLIWALIIALIGGLFPSIRAARQPIVAGLRAT
jgi:putative ABC transport system permease protein